MSIELLKRADGSIRWVDDNSGNVVSSYDADTVNIVAKTALIPTTATSDITLFTLPIGAIVTSASLFATVASDDTGTATISAGITSHDTYFFSATSVKTAAITRSALITAMGASLSTTATTNVIGKYAGQNSNATVGTFRVVVEYFVPAGY